MRQGAENANNLKRSLVTYHKCRETAGNMSFASGAETLIYGPKRSSTYCNGSLNSSRGEAKGVNS